MNYIWFTGPWQQILQNPLDMTCSSLDVPSSLEESIRTQLCLDCFGIVFSLFRLFVAYIFLFFFFFSAVPMFMPKLNHNIIEKLSAAKTRYPSIKFDACLAIVGLHLHASAPVGPPGTSIRR